MKRTVRIVIDANGTVVDADPGFQAMLRATRDQIGVNALAITAPGDRDRCTRLVGQVIADGRQCRTMKRMIRADGTQLWVRNTLTLVTAAALAGGTGDDPGGDAGGDAGGARGGDARLIAIEIEETAPPPGWVAPDMLLRTARLAFDSRRGRAAAFGAELFCDPAWDLLLSAYICEAEAAVTTIARVHARTGMPLVDASRWMRALRAAGLLEYEDGGNMALVTRPFRLTSAAHLKFETYLSDLYLRAEQADRGAPN